MKKKALFSTLFALCFGLIFSFSSVFATNTNPVDGIRNFMGGAENMMQDAATGISNGMKNTTGAMENGMNNTFNTENDNMMANNTEVMGSMITNNNNGGYTATRTATGFTEPTLFGINVTTWTWIVMAITAVAIITLIWSYTREKKEYYNSYEK